jgi:hypothetical protein
LPVDFSSKRSSHRAAPTAISQSLQKLTHQAFAIATELELP